MHIDFNYDPSTEKAPPEFKTALSTAARFLEGKIHDPINLTIEIGYGNVAGNPVESTNLAETTPAGNLLSYRGLIFDLRKAATSTNDKLFLNSLSKDASLNNGWFFISTAQQKAWGLPIIQPTINNSNVDGWTGFNDKVPWDYSQADGISPGTVDFVGIAIHELTHALGRALLGTPPTNPARNVTALSLLSYSSSDPNLKNALYLSFDAGKTPSAYFDPTKLGSSDFATNPPLPVLSVPWDMFNSGFPVGVSPQWTGLDSRIMDVLGFDVGEPRNIIIPITAPNLPFKFSIYNQTTNVHSDNDGKPTLLSDDVQNEYTNITSESLNITANASFVYIHTGSGNDTLDLSNVAGRNKLDGGGGSNLLIGSKNVSAYDTFYVDNRTEPTDVWSTIVNFHKNDDAVVWGLTPNDFKLAWVDNQGLPGSQGLTLHASAAGKPAVSLTLAGYTTADLNNGRLHQEFGAVEGKNYMKITAVS